MNAPISSPTTNMTNTAAAAFTSSSTATSNSHQGSPSSSNAGNSSFAKAPTPPPAPAQKTPSTDVFIRDLNLVAEAAKRAQMAVLMRDIEGITIS